MSDKYPELSEKLLFPLRIAIQQAASDPEYLTDPACPYPSDIKRLLSVESVNNDTEGDGTFLGAAGDRSTIIAKEAAALYMQLTTVLKDTVKLDISEKIAILKTQAGLLEKLINIQERAENMASIAEFQRTVLDTLEELMPPKDWEVLFSRLKK